MRKTHSTRTRVYRSTAPAPLPLHAAADPNELAPSASVLKVEPKRLPPRRVGRYTLFGEIAAGGMATVYFGRLAGSVGFSRSVAIKQLHSQYAKSPEFVAQFLDEAQLSARVRHPNVVSVLDVVARNGELFVIMDFIDGEPLSRLVRFASEPVPLTIASAILIQALLGLHAAHEATMESGEPLEIVHRDVSPQNILVGTDGSSRILDFGVAKAAARVHSTGDGKIKGKLGYMAPEQLCREQTDRRVDVFAAGVVLWEVLAGRRLFGRDDLSATVTAILGGDVAPPSRFRSDVPQALDALVLKALAVAPIDRYATAREMAVALESCIAPANNLAVGAWVRSVAADSLQARALLLREAEESQSANTVGSAQALQQRLAHASERPGESSSIPPRDALTTSPSIPYPRRRRWLGGAALIISLALLTIVDVVVMRWPATVKEPQQAHFATAVAAPGVDPTVASAPLPTLAPAVQPRSTAAESRESPPDTPTPKAVNDQTSLAKRGVAVQARKPSLALSSAPLGLSTPSECSPPYWLDPLGKKKFKPECF